jgi:hypothetical protein
MRGQDFEEYGRSASADAGNANRLRFVAAHAFLVTFFDNVKSFNHILFR